MHAPIDKDDIEPRSILQDAEIGQRIAIHNDAVRIKPGEDLPQLVLAHEELGHARGRGDDAFIGGESEEFLEMDEISCVGSVGGPCESVVTIYDQSDHGQLLL
jgi:hypothetical protein